MKTIMRAAGSFAAALSLCAIGAIGPAIGAEPDNPAPDKPAAQQTEPADKTPAPEATSSAAPQPQPADKPAAKPAGEAAAQPQAEPAAGDKNLRRNPPSPRSDPQRGPGTRGELKFVLSDLDFSKYFPEQKVVVILKTTEDLMTLNPWNMSWEVSGADIDVCAGSTLPVIYTGEPMYFECTVLVQKGATKISIKGTFTNETDFPGQVFTTNTVEAPVVTPKLEASASTLTPLPDETITFTGTVSSNVDGVEVDPLPKKANRLSDYHYVWQASAYGATGFKDIDHCRDKKTCDVTLAQLDGRHFVRFLIVNDDVPVNQPRGEYFPSPVIELTPVELTLKFIPPRVYAEGATAAPMVAVCDDMSGAVKDFDYRWLADGKTPPVSTQASYVPPTAYSPSAHVYSYICTPKGKPQPDVLAKTSVYVLTKPSDVTVRAGKSAAFAVKFNGNAKDVTWYKGDPRKDGVKIKGSAGKLSYTVAKAKASMDGQLFCAKAESDPSLVQSWDYPYEGSAVTCAKLHVKKVHITLAKTGVNGGGVALLAVALVSVGSFVVFRRKALN